MTLPDKFVVAGPVLVRVAVTCLLIALLPLPALSQEAVFSTFIADGDAYSELRWTTDSGLPANNVVDLAQTPDGYLWVATANGLMRFDGRRMVRIEPPAFDGNGPPSMFQLVVDHAGALWASVYGGFNGRDGLARLVGDRWEVVHRYDGFVFDLAAATDGSIWAVLSSGRVVERRHDGEVVIRDVPYAINNGKILADRSGRVWVYAIGGSRILRVEGQQVVAFELPARDSRPTGMIEGDDGRLWVATATNLLTFGEGHFETVAVDGDHDEGSVTSMARDERGDLWLFHRSRSVSRLRLPERNALPQVVRATSVPYRPPGVIFAGMADAEGNLWLATNAAGLVQLRPRKLVPSVNAVPAGALAMAPRTSDTAWIVANCRAMILGADGSRDVDSIPDSADAPCTTGITSDRTGAMWLTSEPNLVTRITERVTATYAYPDSGPLSSDPTPPVGRPEFLIADPAGEIWYYRRGRGIVHVSSEGDQTLFPIEAGPGSETLRALRAGLNGDIWFASDTGFGRLRRGEIRQWESVDWLGGAIAFDVHVDAEGFAWVASAGAGLFRVGEDDVSGASRLDGLPFDSIKRILETDDGDFWLLGVGGVVVVSRRSVSDFLDGNADVPPYGVLGRRDGAPELGFTTTMGFKGRDGRLWIKGDSLVVVDPAEVRWNAARPVVVIEETSTSDGESDGADLLTLSSGAERLEIPYTVPTFDHPALVRFRYRLDDHDDAWIDAQDQRLATYTDLWPGDYTFRVVARKNFSPWSEESLLRIRVLPRWWQTTWFMVVAMLGIMALGAATQTLRTRSLRRRNIALEREIAAREAAEADLKDLGQQMITAQEDDRARIARELHDDVSQRLAAMSIGLEMSVGAIRENPETVEGQLRPLQSQLDEVSDDLRKVSHELHPDVLHNLGLETALEVLCEEFQSQTGVVTRKSFTGSISEAADEVALCLYRVTQEALQNVMKHARASEVELELAMTASDVRLLVRDDGVGFGTEEPRSGLGLASIRERTRLLNGSLVVESQPGAGAELVVTIPTTEATP